MRLYCIEYVSLFLKTPSVKDCYSKGSGRIFLETRRKRYFFCFTSSVLFYSVHDNRLHGTHHLVGGRRRYRAERPRCWQQRGCAGLARAGCFKQCSRSRWVENIAATLISPSFSRRSAEQCGEAEGVEQPRREPPNHPARSAEVGRDCRRRRGHAANVHCCIVYCDGLGAKCEM